MDPDNFFLFDHVVGADGSRPLLLEQPSREGLYNVLFNSKLASNLSCSHLEHPLKSGDKSWIPAGSYDRRNPLAIYNTKLKRCG